MNRYLILLISFLLLGFSSEAQKILSLTDVIVEAKTKSIRSKQIENRYQNSYWRNFSYKKQFLPSLIFDGTLPQIQRSISSVTQPDGSELFVNRNVFSSSANLRLNQVVPLVGGNFFVGTGLDHIRLSGNSSTITYLSRPIEFGYSQNLFGFNQYKWDRKIEPLFFNEAELLKTEEVEALSIESVNKYFDLLRSQLSLENAEKNFLNNDTIYKIGKGRYSYGKIAENELLQLELSLLNSEMAFEQEKVNFELSRQRLATFLGYPSTENIKLELDTLIPNFEVNYTEALKYAKELNSELIQYNREIFEADMRVARVKSANRFSLDLTATFGLSQTADNVSDAYVSPQNQEFISLGVRVPILQWGLGKGRIQQAKTNAELVRSTVEQGKIDFDQKIYVTVANFNLNKKQLSVSKRANEVADKRFFVSKQRYLLGKTIITDLQIAQQEKDRALISYINAYRAFWRSYYDVRQITHYDFEMKEVIK
ncbi:MAG: TolC family protein [Flavobacteriales bacterium]|nr:TolC family protein [Flavobacteriales bacterium]